MNGLLTTFKHWVVKVLARVIRKISVSRVYLIKYPLISLFIKTYGINIQEAEYEKLRDYQSFNDFFTRSLKDDVRTISNREVVSPVDGELTQWGKIERGILIEAKGMDYQIADLLAESSKGKDFESGQFFTLYLSPKDYHRVHMPFDGSLQSMDYIPGTFYSVTPNKLVQHQGLLAKNERLVCYFETAFGPAVVIMVGARFVSGIETVWQGRVYHEGSQGIQHYVYHHRTITLEKGDEMGRFNLGSTVIVLLPISNLKLIPLQKSLRLNVGQALSV